MANRKASPGEINGDAIDRFTLIHFLAGAIAAKCGISLFATSILALGWELAENRLKDSFPDVFPNKSHDSIENAIVDAIAMTLGHIVARKV